MPAIPRNTNIPRDWKDGVGDIISLHKDGNTLSIRLDSEEIEVYLCDENYKNEVEDFLEWFNSEVRRLYDIEE